MEKYSEDSLHHQLQKARREILCNWLMLTDIPENRHNRELEREWMSVRKLIGDDWKSYVSLPKLNFASSQ